MRGRMTMVRAGVNFYALGKKKEKKRKEKKTKKKKKRKETIQYLST